MATVRAVVLAAGRGVRMGGEHPKTLLPLDGGRPLLDYIIAGLKSAGIGDLLVVTGFKHAEVQAFVDEHAGDLSVSYTRNARYASWGNFHSLRVALDQSPGFDVLVVNSDVIVHPDVIGRVMSAPGDLVLAVQKRLVLNQEDMRVRLQVDRVRGIGKDLARAHSHGEYAGVSLLRSRAAQAYNEVASNLEWRGDTDRYYEDVYADILTQIDARAASVGEDEYAEVDTPEDVRAAVAVLERHADVWGSPAGAPA